MIEWRLTTIGRCRDLANVPQGATIDAVDGVPCLGMCENCRRPILVGEDYYYDIDNVVWHKVCPST